MRFSKENASWKAFLKNLKKIFQKLEIDCWFSKKIGLSVGEFKKLVSRIQKGEESRIAKKEMVEIIYVWLFQLQKNIQTEAYSF